MMEKKIMSKPPSLQDVKTFTSTQRDFPRDIQNCRIALSAAAGNV